MRISYHKNPLSMDDVKKSFHCSIFSKVCFSVKIEAASSVLWSSKTAILFPKIKVF